jgi:autotransporter-associated beta strand protein
VNYKTGGQSIFYLTADDTQLARVFADQTLSPSTPPTLLDIDVIMKNGKLLDYYDYQANRDNGVFANGIVVALNAVNPTELLFRSSRLYTWTDPGGALSGSIGVTDISTQNLFDTSAWSEKIAYGTQDAPDAILAGGPLPANLTTKYGTYGVYLRTEQQFQTNPMVSAANNLLTAYSGLNGGNPGDPVGVLFDPATQNKFFIADTINVYATQNLGANFTTLALPNNFQNPESLGYIANETGGANNGVRALLVGGSLNMTDGQGGIVSTLDPFAANVQWMNLAAGLPNAEVTDLEYYPSIDTLVASVYGRGVWTLYDVTSHFAAASELWFGKADNDSNPSPSLLTGDRPLEKFGTGTLTLSGVATYTGGTIIDSGTVAITADANLGAPQGGITFNGGVLQINAPLTTARAVTLNAEGMLDIEHSATFSGQISGAGALDKTGPAMLTLGGANSYSGGTIIDAGTIAITADVNLGAPQGGVTFNDATLQINAPLTTARAMALNAPATFDIEANATFSGQISGAGALDKIGPATLTLTGVNTYSGGTVIQAGTLAAGADAAFGASSGQIGIDAATLAATASFSTARTIAIGADGATIDTGANTLTANGFWAAQGPLTKIGAGTLALEDLAWLQATNVSAGTLEVDGSLTGTSLIVNSSAALTGNGQIGAPTLIQGVLAPGKGAPGALTFSSAVRLSAGSELAIAIDGPATTGGPGSYSQVIVSGDRLTLGGTLAPMFRGIVGGSNTFTPTLGEQFAIAQATGGVAGQFSTIAQAGDGLPTIERLDLIYGSNVAVLAVAPASFTVAPVGAASLSFNQRNVGATLDALRPASGAISANANLQNVFNTLYGLDGPQLAQALTGLSGQGAATTLTSELNAIDAIHNALESHLLGEYAPSFGLPSMILGGGARDFSASVANVAPDALGYADSQSAAPALEPGHIWGTAFAQSNHLNSSAGIAGVNSTVGGFIAGLEGPVGQGPTLGAAFAAAQSNGPATTGALGDVYALVGYGRQKYGGLDMAAYAGFARGLFDFRQDFGPVAGLGANGTSGASSLLAGGVLAFPLDFHSFTVAPTAMASYTHMKFDGMDAVATSGGAALFIPGQWTDRLRFTLGPTVAHSWTTANGVAMSGHVAGGWLYDNNPFVSLDTALFGLPTAARSAPSGRNGGFVEIGFDAALTGSVSAFVNLRSEARSQAWNDQISAGIGVAF